MSMGVKLAALAGTGRVQICVIGAGKFGPMFRHRARRTRGFHVVGVHNRPRKAIAPFAWAREALRGTRRTGGTVLLEGADRRRRRGHQSLTDSLRHALA